MTAVGLPNTQRLIAQVAGEAGVSKTRAMRAIYLRDLAVEGRDVAAAAAALKMQVDTIKRYAREFDIRFKDYQPYTNERAMAMLKARGKKPIEKRKLNLKGKSGETAAASMV